MRSASRFGVLLGAVALCWAQGVAQAQSLAACGDIHVEAEAQCEVVPPSAQCKTQCTPLTVQAACAAKLTAECEGQCTAQASLDCNASCDASCHASCDVDPGKFDCTANCQAHCGGTCSGHCEASANKAECQASCETSCGASCNADCDVQLPSATCDGECQASCSGSCSAQANLDCQIDCQAKLFVDCSVDVQGGCETACETSDGALFCDGQYVDYNDNLAMCVDALRAVVNANVQGYAEGSGMCANGTCTGTGQAGVSCSAMPGLDASSAPGALALFGLGLAWLRRRNS